MTYDDAELLAETWKKIAAHGDQVPLTFYSALFLAHPELRALFPPGLAAQRAKLVAAFDAVVSAAADLDAMRPTLHRLGRMHRRFGVEPEHYGYVAEAVLFTFAEFLGDEWTPTEADTWGAALGAVALEMQAGADAQGASGLKACWDVQVFTIEREGLDTARLSVVLDVDTPGLANVLDSLVDSDTAVAVAPIGRAGLWTTAMVTRSSSHHILTVKVADSDFASLAVAQTKPGSGVRLAPPDLEALPS